MEMQEFVTNLFMWIGIIISVVTVTIATVWLVCFIIKLLIKTFGYRVKTSYEIMTEDIAKKGEAKKERKALKRKAQSEQKMELLNIKLASKQKIHEMKKQKLQQDLKAKEEQVQKRIFESKNSDIEEAIKKIDSKQNFAYKADSKNEVNNNTKEKSDDKQSKSLEKEESKEEKTEAKN